MSKKLKQELENLVQIIMLRPEGISTEELLIFLPEGTPKRTIQYRLSILVKEGILRNEKTGRNSKYYVNKIWENNPQLENAKVQGPQITFKIPFSDEAEELRKLITAPIQLRQHVSYRRAFLDSY